MFLAHPSATRAVGPEAKCGPRVIVALSLRGIQAGCPELLGEKRGTMIQIRVHAGKDPERRIHELCDAVQHARIWRVKDRRCTRNLNLIHSSGTVTGSIHRAKSRDPEYLEFECKAKDRTLEAITAGRFVNLVLRDMASVTEVDIHRP